MILPLGTVAVGLCYALWPAHIAADTILNAGKMAELSGLDRKEVDKAMQSFKDEGAMASPVRCKLSPVE